MAIKAGWTLLQPEQMQWLKSRQEGTVMQAEGSKYSLLAVGGLAVVLPVL